MSRTASTPSPERAAFLAEINADVPEGVDWKRGAVEYLRQLVETAGDHNVLYHLAKPFLGGPDFTPFYREMGQFVATVQELDLPMRSSVLDVACGPGWVAHYLAKLGHRVLGIDISPDLVELARRRLDAEPFAPYVDTPLRVDFLVHDIEASPIPGDERFDVAYLESCLHHFYDPIAALDHIGESLAPDGRLCIIEGSAPPPGSPEAAHMREVMQRYDTLERPYTRDQFERLLDLAGFRDRRFYRPISGLFENTRVGVESLRSQLAEAECFNLCIASRGEPESVSRLEFLDGFYANEGADGEVVRWAGTESRLRLTAPGVVELVFSTHDLARGPQSIHVDRDGEPIEAITLTVDAPEQALRVEVDRPATLRLVSDRCFSPSWTGSADRRVLSFLCRARWL